MAVQGESAVALLFIYTTAGHLFAYTSTPGGGRLSNMRVLEETAKQLRLLLDMA